MLRKTLTILSLIGLLLSVGLWIVQLPGPAEFCNGPRFRDVRWQVVDHAHVGPSWGMWDPTGVKDVYSKTVGGGLPFGALEVPKEEAPPFDDHSLLLGVGFGYVHWGLAYFYSVPDPAVDPSPGMVYVCSSHVGVSVPLWLLIILFSAQPLYVLFFHYHRPRKRKKLGLCLKCGYDLRGSKERCPECGARFEKPKLDADC
ncbi:MAG: hypothetical protein IIB58_12630 [Planctomycetes bacterium]|nr:hypothetical protein [Planctomycetota bacterium]